MSKKQLCRDIYLILKENLLQDDTYEFQLDVENVSPYTIQLSFDFMESKKTRFTIAGTDGKIDELKNPLFEEFVQPGETKTVVSLQATNNWIISYGLEYLLQFPDKRRIADKMKNEDVRISRRTRDYNKTVDLLKGYDFSEIIEELNSRNINYIDSKFPPNMSSFSKNPAELDKLPFMIHWRTLEDTQKDFDTVGEEIQIFEKSMHPLDVHVNIPYFPLLIFAMVLLAENSELITKLFMTKTYNKQYFSLRLCRQMAWEEITLDCFLPHLPFDQTLFFETHYNMIWPQVLEKAYAKNRGGYERMSCIPLQNILADLSGCPIELYELKKKGIYI